MGCIIITDQATHPMRRRDMMFKPVSPLILRSTVLGPVCLRPGFSEKWAMRSAGACLQHGALLFMEPWYWKKRTCNETASLAQDSDTNPQKKRQSPRLRPWRRRPMPLWGGGRELSRDARQSIMTQKNDAQCHLRRWRRCKLEVHLAKARNLSVMSE